VFFVILAVIIFAYAFETQVKDFFIDYHSFKLNEITLEDMNRKEVTIPTGFRGYVIFYSDVAGCHVCMLKLTNLRELSTIYDDIGFFSVAKRREAHEEFLQLMAKYDIPGEYLVDPDQKIARYLALSEHPALLFFDRNRHLLAKLPLDLEHEKLLRLFHIYINEM